MEKTCKNVIMVFMKAPVEGIVKTRLQKDIGADITLSIYKVFVKDAVAKACEIGNTLIFSYPGELISYTKNLFDGRKDILSQKGDNLGDKMGNAFKEVFDDGYDKAVLIGTDIPDLKTGILKDAFEKLDSYGCVLGPSMDGGYYLVGFRKDFFEPDIFSGIKWSNNEVLKNTLDKIKQKDISCALTRTLNDIDTIEDLKGYLSNKDGSETRSKIEKILGNGLFPEPIDISVIIPVLNEVKTINETIKSVRKVASNIDLEIIVSDGDDKGSTIDIIKDENITKVLSSPGRGVQMNNGAKEAKGNILLFLHSDTKLPKNAFFLIKKTIEKDGFDAGAFDLSIDSTKFRFRIIEKVASLRSRITGTPFGDQALFVRKDAFEKAGGFKEIPIMEDINIIRRIKRNSGIIRILKRKVITSPRRWEKEGVVFCTLRNWFILILYFLGVSPTIIKKIYK